MREFGGVLGIAVTVAVFGSRGGFVSPADFVDGFTGALLAASGLSLLGAVVGLRLPTRRLGVPRTIEVDASDDRQAVAA
jgi:hypothetical protein